MAERLIPRLGARDVVDSIRNPAEVEVLRRVPGFVLVGVDAPAELRYARSRSAHGRAIPESLAEFMARERQENSANPAGQQLEATIALADRLVQNSGDLDDLHLAIDELLRRPRNGRKGGVAMDDVVRDRFGAQIEERGGTRNDAILGRVAGPADLKALTPAGAQALCGEIRDYIVDVVSQKGGHLGASLGVVELTVALARVLDLPHDRVVWDTGHQAYVHKVLTGRKDALWGIRQYGGISGFLKREESPYDTFGAGHASTSISAALGMAAARDLAGVKRRVVAIMGDGAMTGGLAYEALNNAGHSGRDLLVILNDNGMSISPNVGALAPLPDQHPDQPTVAEAATGRPRRDGATAARRRKGANSGDAPRVARSSRRSFRRAVRGARLQLHRPGRRPRSPDAPRPSPEGPRPAGTGAPPRHDAGRGRAPAAEADHEGFHGVAPFDKVTGKAIPVVSAGRPGYTAVFGKTMIDAAAAFPKMVAITAAMPSGTGLIGFREAFPHRFYDVGIAEAHGVCFAAAMACEGARPVATIYSTFLQRAFDQVDSRRGVAARSGRLRDRSRGLGRRRRPDAPRRRSTCPYLRCVPGMVVSAPKDGERASGPAVDGAVPGRAPVRDPLPA